MNKQYNNDEMPPLKPEQIRVGTHKIMTYNERLEWLKVSELGRLYRFKQEDKHNECIRCNVSL
jgi:hypothetical protein